MNNQAQLEQIKTCIQKHHDKPFTKELLVLLNNGKFVFEIKQWPIAPLLDINVFRKKIAISKEFSTERFDELIEGLSKLPKDDFVFYITIKGIEDSSNYSFFIDKGMTDILSILKFTE